MSCSTTTDLVCKTIFIIILSAHYALQTFLALL